MLFRSSEISVEIEKNFHWQLQRAADSNEERHMLRTANLNIYIVNKPWGYEMIWAKTPRYVGKVLVIRAGESLSLQYHEKKDETLFLESGEIELEAGTSFNDLKKLKLEPQKAFHVPPGMIHRVRAITEARVFEVSTPELDDVVRLQDLYGRENKESVAA